MLLVVSGEEPFSRELLQLLALDLVLTMCTQNCVLCEFCFTHG